VSPSVADGGPKPPKSTTPLLVVAIPAAVLGDGPADPATFIHTPVALS
jgi:hypothetical protein